MSLTSLATEEVLRIESGDQRSASSIAETAIKLAPAYAVSEPDIRRLMGAATGKNDETKAKNLAAANAFESLVKYIPTESATLYLAAVSAQSALVAAIPNLTPKVSYWFFAFLTPVLFLMIFMGKRRALGQPAFPSSPKDWPWFKTAAAFVAFLAWGLAVPGNPYATSEQKSAAFAFGALLVSTVLSLLQAVIDPKSD